WNDIAYPTAAQDWAVAWGPEVQGYIHAYRMAKGGNLSDDMVEVRRVGDSRYLQPSLHLRNRTLAEQRQRGQLGAGGGSAAGPASGTSLPQVPVNRNRP